MSELNIATDLMNELVKNAFDILSDGEVTFGEIVRLGGILAGKANRLVHLSGLEKQALVVKVVEIALRQVLDSKLSFLSESDRDSFRQKVADAAVFAKETLPAVLDVAVSAARGQLDLRKPSVHKVLFALMKCIGCQSPSVATPVSLPSAPAPESQSSSESQVATEKKNQPNPPEEVLDPNSIVTRI